MHTFVPTELVGRHEDPFLTFRDLKVNYRGQTDSWEPKLRTDRVRLAQFSKMDQICGANLTKLTHQIGMKAGVEIPVLNFHKRLDPNFLNACTQPKSGMSSVNYENIRPVIDIASEYNQLISAAPDLSSRVSIPLIAKEDNRSANTCTRNSTPFALTNLSAKAYGEIVVDNQTYVPTNSTTLHKETQAVTANSTNKLPEHPPPQPKVIAPTEQSLNQLSSSNPSLNGPRGALISRQSALGTPFEKSHIRTSQQKSTFSKKMFGVSHPTTQNQQTNRNFPTNNTSPIKQEFIPNDEENVFVPFRGPRAASEIPIDGSLVESHYPDSDSASTCSAVISPSSSAVHTALPTPRDQILVCHQSTASHQKGIKNCSATRLERISDWIAKEPQNPIAIQENWKEELPFEDPKDCPQIRAQTASSCATNGLAYDWPKSYKVPASLPRSPPVQRPVSLPLLPPPALPEVLEKQAFANLLANLHVEARATLQPLYTPRDVQKARETRPLSSTTARRRDAAPATNAFVLTEPFISGKHEKSRNKHEVAYALVSTERKAQSPYSLEVRENNAEERKKDKIFTELECKSKYPGQHTLQPEEWRAVTYRTGHRQCTIRGTDNDRTLTNYWNEIDRRTQRIYNSPADALISARREKEEVPYGRQEAIGWQEVCKHERKARDTRGREWPGSVLYI